MKKQMKFLTLALALFVGMTLTSCLDSDSDSTGYDGAGIVYVRHSMGVSYFADALGNIYYPTAESLNAIQANNPAFDMSSYRMAFIYYSWPDSESADASTPTLTQSYNIDLLSIQEVEVYDTEITSTQATMESSMPETSPLLPLNAGSSSSGFPAMYDSDMLMATIGYFVGSESSLQNHRVRVAYVDEEVDPSSTEMTLYLRHDRGSDEGTTYTNYFYGGINVSTAVQSFRAKTGNYPTRIVLKAKESQAATTVLPSTYTNYTVTYKAPSE